jgi:hypothetical protein
VVAFVEQKWNGILSEDLWESNRKKPRDMEKSIGS